MVLLVPDVYGFVDPFTVGVVFVVPGSPGWALYNRHAVSVMPKADGTNGEYDGGVVGWWSHETVCLCVIPKGPRFLRVRGISLFSGGWGEGALGETGVAQVLGFPGTAGVGW